MHGRGPVEQRIAAALGLAIRPCFTAAIIGNFGANNRTDAVRRAIRQGLWRSRARSAQGTTRIAAAFANDRNLRDVDAFIGQRTVQVVDTRDGLAVERNNQIARADRRDAADPVFDRPTRTPDAIAKPISRTMRRDTARARQPSTAPDAPSQQA